MSVEGEPLDSDGFKRLRKSVANGEIEGENYTVTQDPGSGAIHVEFGKETYVYHLSDIVRDAYSNIYEDDEGAVGKCEECGDAIPFGEWHVAEKPGADDPTRYCLDCSDLDPEEYPPEAREEDE